METFLWDPHSWNSSKLSSLRQEIEDGLNNKTRTVIHNFNLTMICLEWKQWGLAWLLGGLGTPNDCLFEMPSRKRREFLQARVIYSRTQVRFCTLVSKGFKLEQYYIMVQGYWDNDRISIKRCCPKNWCSIAHTATITLCSLKRLNACGPVVDKMASLSIPSKHCKDKNNSKVGSQMRSSYLHHLK